MSGPNFMIINLKVFKTFTKNRKSQPHGIRGKVRSSSPTSVGFFLWEATKFVENVISICEVALIWCYFSLESGGLREKTDGPPSRLTLASREYSIVCQCYSVKYENRGFKTVLLN